MNTLVMSVFGGVSGFILCVLPNRTPSKIPFDLDQDWKFWRNTVWMLWIVIVSAVTLLTAVEFRWTPFLVSTLVAASLTTAFMNAILEGKMLPALSERMRVLYRNEWYRYVRYEPKVEKFLDAFDQTAPRSLGNVLTCAHLSAWAYRSKDDITERSASWGVPVQAIEERNHFALVVRLPSAVIVAFRGTDEARDWLTNLAMWQRSPWGAEWGSVHAGFLGAVDALWPKLTNALRELKCTDDVPVWLTGHSLGGAMALIAAIRLMNERSQVRIDAVYTFGQPMVGNREFAKVCGTRLADRFARFVATRDDIPNHPASGAHGGTLVFFDRHGTLRENPGRGVMFWEGLRRASLGAAGDHPMREYLRLVEACAYQSATASRDAREADQVR